MNLMKIPLIHYLANSVQAEVHQTSKQSANYSASDARVGVYVCLAY